MARLQLNKSSLHKENKALKTFERFLPSLDLKRRQLLAERKSARDAWEKTEREMRRLRDGIGAELPMLANREVDLSELVVVEHVEIGEVNVVGVRLPALIDSRIRIRPYALMGKPTWVDRVAERLTQILGLRIRLLVEKRRRDLLDEAVRRITQRVNLFDKVLIPRARRNIRRIRIYLSDQERAAVVRSKIAKRKSAVMI